MIRFFFPVIIGLPFLIGTLIPHKTTEFTLRSSAISAILVFCTLVVAGAPMLRRPDRKSIERCDAVLTLANELNAKSVLLATDSPSLNYALMRLASAVLSSRPTIQTDSLATNVVSGSSIEDDFRQIDESDLVVFQNKEALDPPFTNQRVSEYEQYTQRHSGSVPFKVFDDISIYQIDHHRQ
jgi:hypothetical protein